ncbi:L-aspartate oxidase [Sulfurospirillum barnesii]|uniref:Succinate dehydrogenase/fumarate reductase flavoprotein subunit n=1 Tax=Sulfurospirillum barnesii (strain ATCC 700032 / DSM 10660 / SES-3) TaxID=760154 RepID=I3XWP7_SULBS|nr:FAD-dependent oxidoreductase [Sulfurospirillum barnesii]AFL68371.1 succinate dehydrogenase/fumarate reductase flavoprotein subunit [Sulfurospirillum barnesii SES-3]
MSYDVIVIGSGIAGLMAAIEAKGEGNSVALMCKGNIFKSNSALASGGINAVLDENDKALIMEHISDTYKSAKDVGNKKAIAYLCEQAPHVIKKLQSYGVLFDRDEAGNILQRSFGGGSDKRTCFVGDSTGAAIIQVLIKHAKEVGIDFLVNHFVMDITTIEEYISGVVALKKVDSSVSVYPAKSVVFAGGGYAGIYRGFSTNAQDCTGDMLSIALRAGLSLKDMEFVQFHPTGFAKTGYLVSEAARGEGGYLINSKGERFVNELGTRDVLARAIFEQMRAGQKVFIDMRHIPKETLLSRVPSLYKSAYNQAGIDLCCELLEIKPVAHYSMGGIESTMCETAIKGLFACGECAALGVHGANRLGGNSLLEGGVFGVLAGKKAREYVYNREFLPIDYRVVIKNMGLVERIFEGDCSKNFNAMRISVGKIMFDKVGIYRNETRLQEAFDYMKYLRLESNTLHCVDKSKNNNVELISILELRNALELSEAIILSAMYRKESRGAHFREDYVFTCKEGNRHVLIRELQKGFFKVQYEESPFLRWLKKILT